MSMKKRQNGFTLVELMVTIAVAAVLVAFAVPAYQRLAATNRSAAEVNSLVANIQAARSEAVNRGRSISVCARSGSSLKCGVNWKDGGLVFEDLNANGNLDAGESVLRVWDSAAGNNTAFTASTSSFTFNPMGELVGGATVKVQLDVAKGTVDQQTRCIQVSVAGLLRHTSGGCP